MAARHAGRDPDELVTMTFAGEAAFDGSTRRDPDFPARSEAAFDALTTSCLTVPSSLNGLELPAVARSDRHRHETRE